MGKKLRRQFTYSPSPANVVVAGNATMATRSTEAAATLTSEGNGIKSVARTAAGTFTVNLNDVYNKLLAASMSININPTAATTNACADGYLCQIAGEWVDGVSGVNDGDGYLKMETAGHAGTVADPLSGELQFVLVLGASERS